MPAEPVPAATVVVLRDTPPGPEVLLVRRRERGTFAGASVFPGGMVDAADGDPALAPPLSGFSLELAIAAVGPSFPPAITRALYVAACRELFEEAGILLARHVAGQPAEPGRVLALQAERPGLQQNAQRLASVLESADLILALDELVPVAHWITPENQPRRWDTLFLLAAAPHGQAEQADGAETSEAVWLRPPQALDAYMRGDHLLAPPTFRVLEELAAFRNVAEALQRTRAAGAPPVILPVPLTTAPEATLVYPGDRDYPGSDASGQNRLTLHEGRWRSLRSS